MKFNEARKIAAFANQIEKVIGDFSTIAGVEAINHFTRNFVKQGFDDSGVTPWKSRKGGRMGWSNSRAILVKSGALRRSLNKRRAGKFGVIIFSPLKYAKLMNDGGTIKRGEHSRNKTIIASVKGNSGFVNGKFTRGRSRKIKLTGEVYGVKANEAVYPARPFMGESRKLNKKILQAIDRRVNKAFEFGK